VFLSSNLVFRLRRKVLLKERTCIDAYLIRSRALFYEGDVDAAKTLLTIGMRVDPDNRQCRNQLGVFRQMVTLKEEGNAAFQAGRFQGLTPDTEYFFCH